MSEETTGLTIPVRANITDFTQNFDRVSNTANRVSSGVVRNLDDMTRAQERLVASSRNRVDLGVISNPDMINRVTGAQSSLNREIAAGTANTASFGNAQARLSDNLRVNHDIFTQFGSHLQTMTSLALVMGAIGLPAELITRVKELEKAMAGVKQVLPELEHDQSSANAELIKFTNIAGKYGESTLEIIDAGRSWGRMYKEQATVNLLVSQSAKMATADNFSLKESVKGLEAAMSQFGMKSKEINEVQRDSNRILDVWTKLAHSGGASASDLVSGVERAGSTAHQAGVSFEFFNAMIATGVRNTALSGSEIGNALKSMFINFKTDKATKEIEKFGISMTQINEDGTKSFRNTQDVILDLSLAVQNTDKDTSKLFTSLFGKFQNSKLTSIITDYKQVIENWQNAVNSTNFTDEQVAVQMDTISRKVGTTKALLDTLVAGASNAGLATFIKEQLASINNFLVGLQSVSSNMFGVIGTTIKWTAELYLLTKVCGSVHAAINAIAIATRASAAAKSVDTVATVLNTEAKIAENLATASLNRTIAVSNAIRGNIIPLLILGAAAMYSYSESVGQTNNAIQRQSDAEATRLEQSQRSTEEVKQQKEFILGLANAYDKQSESLLNAGENTEKGKRIKEEMTFLETKLTEELNHNSEANDVNSENIIENGKINRDVIDQNIKAKELHSAELAQSLLRDAESLGNEAAYHKKFANDKIKDMENEITMLGVLERAYLGYLNFMSGIYNKIADMQEQDANDAFVFPGVTVEKTPEQKAAQLATVASYRNKANNYIKQRTSTAEDYIGISQMLRDSKEEQLLSTKIKSDFAAKNTNSPGTVTDKAGKNKGSNGSNSSAPSDKAEQQWRNELKHDINGKFNEDKISADKYAMSLDLINLKESVLGVNQDSMSQRQLAMKNRVSELLGTAMEYKELSGDYDKQAQDLIESNADLKTELDGRKMTWKSMTKDQKEAFKEQHKDFMEANKDILALDDAAEKLNVKSSDLSKEANKTAVDSLQRLISDQNAIYNADFQRNNLDKEISILGLGNDYKKEQSDIIELTTSIKNLTLAKNRLQEIEKIQGKDSVAYKQQLVVIGQLVHSVDALKDKSLVVRQSMASLFDGMMRGTTTFKDFWKNAWYDMMTDAINSIWKVNQAGQSSSLLSQIFGAFGSKNVSNTGQFLTSNNQVLSGPVQASGKFASGGQITGAGTGTSDSILIRASNGEFMMQDSAVKKYGVGFLNSLNQGKIPGFASGGPITENSASIMPYLSTVSNNNSSANTSSSNVQHIAVNISQNYQSLDPATNMKLQKAQNASMKSEILNAIKTETSWRSAVKGAAR